jgi:hypothetical protein
MAQQIAQLQLHSLQTSFLDTAVHHGAGRVVVFDGEVIRENKGDTATWQVLSFKDDRYRR